MKLVHWPLVGGLLHLVQRGGDWAGPQPVQASTPLLTVLNVTAHPSTASVPITVLLYNGPLLCGFNVPIKGLKFVKIRKNSLGYWGLCLRRQRRFLKTHKQQQNVMLREAGPHMTSCLTRSKRKLDNNVGALRNLS